MAVVIITIFVAWASLEYAPKGIKDGDQVQWVRQPNKQWVVVGPPIDNAGSPLVLIRCGEIEFYVSKRELILTENDPILTPLSSNPVSHLSRGQK